MVCEDAFRAKRWESLARQGRPKDRVTPFDEDSHAWLDGTLPLLHNLDSQSFDGVSDLLPERNHLIVPQLRFTLEEVAELLEGCLRPERAFRPRVHQPLDAEVSEGPAVG